ncbi:DUF402 domain-containing protein [Microbacterium protaetiae]|uniref:DUF402 domain-containing protein n=1 Tax=Microbacterium protaetiae TaxID=2509458 RepID=A0A4P6ERC2_9MICO|nr:DUF402 domain-containing protein [Microbacterium protaetiae]QAY60448.1 DUF402 domain-containing protein [Microbacterium protaetiae]
MTTAQRPEPGTRLIFRWRKWDGSPHWEHDCVYLGSDELGDWVGQPTGWHSHRPGKQFTTESPNVTLITPDPTWAGTFYGGMHPRHVRIYIDIAWDVQWTGAEPTAIDMDLDVVRCDDQRGIWIDDEDEWDEHRVLYDYPADVQATLAAKAIELKAQVTAETPPFDDATAQRWLDRLAALTPDAPRLDG